MKKAFMTTSMKKLGFALSLYCVSTGISAAESDWYVKPMFGVSFMSNPDSAVTDVSGFSGNTDIDTDNGFNAGLAFGYIIDEHWAVELAWEYRTNDSTTQLGDVARFDDGNYASNLFFLNGIYRFKAKDAWTPYVGAGLSYAQEIDIDLEQNGVEQSYSGDGDIGYQVFTGIDYKWSQSLSMQVEVRYGNISGVELEAETGSGRFDDIDYTTTTLQTSLIYRF